MRLKKTKEFIPFNKAFKISKNIAAFRVPKTAEKLGYRYTGIGPVKVKDGHKYRLIMDINRAYGDFNTLICASFLKNNKVFQFDDISSGNIISRSGFIKIEQIFIAPKTSEAMILWIGVNNPKTRIIKPGTKIVFKTLTLEDAGPFILNPELKKLLGQNLLNEKA